MGVLVVRDDTLELCGLLSESWFAIGIVVSVFECGIFVVC